MAAVIRSSARRLAGSALLQPAPAAGALPRRTEASGVDELRCPFLARFMSSTDKPVDEIQAKKEELYDMISVTEITNVHTDSYNRVLLQNLSAQIKPRPDDPQWRFMRASKRRSDVIRPAGMVAGFCIGFFSLLMMRAIGAAREQEISQALIEDLDAANEEEEGLA